MEFFVYILYSASLNSYYIGFTENLSERILQHNNKHYSGSFTIQTTDWQLYHVVNCETKRQAIQIEKHIKRMKSRKYIENLKHYAEITQKLLLKYSS